VPTSQVMAVAEREGAIPYDVPNVELGHHGEQCSFDAFLHKYKLTDPALAALALIVRGADTDARGLTPESAGLYALATGFQANAQNDHDNMAKQFPAYDALYAYCRAQPTGAPRGSAAPAEEAGMTLEHVGYVDLPKHVGTGGFDHAAVDERRGLCYVAHTANDAVDVIDCAAGTYLRSIPGLPRVAGALVSEAHD